MSLCGPDNLDQFPLQFISQPTTHLVKQHQASQGRATHPSKPLPTNHILFFFLPEPLSFEVSVLATFPPSFTVNSDTTQPPLFNILLCLYFLSLASIPIRRPPPPATLLSLSLSLSLSLCRLLSFSFFLSPILPPSCHGSSVFCCCLVWSDFAQTRLALGKVRSPESALRSPQVAGTMNTL